MARTTERANSPQSSRRRRRRPACSSAPERAGAGWSTDAGKVALWPVSARVSKASQARHDVVVKLDADLSFDDTYLGELVSCFWSNPRLGIASGACCELENGTWRRRTMSATTVWGASRAYRWEALDAVMDLEPRMGWDGLDELLAHRAGWQTKTFIDLLFRHHRPEHSREPGRWPALAAQGRSSWYMGYRPSYLALRSVYRAREDIAALAMPWGYLRAAMRREPRFGETMMCDERCAIASACRACSGRARPSRNPAERSASRRSSCRHQSPAARSARSRPVAGR